MGICCVAPDPQVHIQIDQEHANAAQKGLLWILSEHNMSCQTCPEWHKLMDDNILIVVTPLTPLTFLSLRLFLTVLRTPLWSVNCPTPLQGDTYSLVLRPLWLLLEFISVCVVFVRCRWDGKCSSYINNYYCFGIMLKKWNKKKRNVLLNVVQIALEMLCSFFVWELKPKARSFCLFLLAEGSKTNCQWFQSLQS